MKSRRIRTAPALAAGAVLISSFALAGSAFAAGPGGTGWQHGRHGGNFPRPAVVGTVASVSGTTLTVTARSWQHDGKNASNTTTYTVNATSATVTKDGATSTVSAIATGDRVMVDGTVSGTTVTATTIHDGAPKGGRFGDRKPPIDTVITGNGDPIVGGTVSAISGNTFTITTKSGTAYTVDGGSATVEKAGKTSTLSAVTKGDQVIVQGTITGTSVTATSVVDHGALPSQSSASTNSSKPAPHGGFFGFLTRLFGFF